MRHQEVDSPSAASSASAATIAPSALSAPPELAAPVVVPLAPATDACLNCGAPLGGEFCATCGQKKPHTDLTLRELLRESTEELTNWDGKVPRTLKTLLLEPGRLTRDFVEGRRARWLRPLRVYLICSVAFFLSKPLVESVTHRSAREVARISITNDDGSTALTPEARQAIEEGIPARIFGTDRLLRAANNTAALNRAIDTAFPKAMFLLLPLFALFTNVAWRARMPRYPAHLYAALHLHAAWFAAFAIGTIATAFVPTKIATLIGVALLLYAIWYALLALKRLFGDSWPRTLAKSVAIGIAYGLALFVMSITMLAYALFTM